MVDDAREVLEYKIAYLERAANELSDVVYRQHNEIKSLQAQVKALQDRVNGPQYDEVQRTPDQERPPHY